MLRAVTAQARRPSRVRSQTSTAAPARAQAPRAPSPEPEVRVSELRLYASYKIDESYTPSCISVRIGTAQHDLQDASLTRPVSSLRDDHAVKVLAPKSIQDAPP